MTFIVVWFAVQLVGGLISAGSYSGELGALLSLPSLIVGALFSTLCLGVVLYYDNESLRVCCLWWIGISALVGLATIGMAVFQGYPLAIATLIPDVFLCGWLAWILMRDRRSE